MNNATIPEYHIFIFGKGKTDISLFTDTMIWISISIIFIMIFLKVYWSVKRVADKKI
jgi:hypothetical protein